VGGSVNRSKSDILEEVGLDYFSCLGISNLALGLTKNLFISFKLILQGDFTFKNCLLQFCELFALSHLTNEIYTSISLTLVFNQIINEGTETDSFGRNSDACLLRKTHCFTDGELVLHSKVERLFLEVDYV
jgi:hypothetical protein